MQEMLSGRNAVHSDASLQKCNARRALCVKAGTEDRGGFEATQPVVRTHPETGRKSLFVNPGFTSHIDGLDANESKAILEFLYHHSTQPQFLYRHRWTEKDLLIWDNRSMMHFAVMDYPDDEPRYMERCTVIGEPPA